MNTIFLIPPSEGKKAGGSFKREKTTFNFKKPCKIATNLTEKELKCSGKRYEQAIFLNKTLCENQQNQFDYAIKRYSGVMYNAIDYENMHLNGKNFFEDNFLIFSGMYGVLKPLDIIGNYKLPLEKSALYEFWGDKISDIIISLKLDYIVNLLPLNYAKLIGLGINSSKHRKKLEKILNSGIKIININFLKTNGKKISHGVKKIKGQWIKNICENNIKDYQNFGGEIIESNNIIDVNIYV